MEKQNSSIEDKKIDLLKIINIAWSSRISILKWTFISMVVGVVVAFSLPKEYKVEVKIAPESSGSSSMSSQLGGLAALAGVNMGGADAMGVNQIIYPDIISSSPFLGELASCNVPYKGSEINFMEYITKNQKKSWFGYLSPFYILDKILGKGGNSDTSNSFDNFQPTKELYDYERSISDKISISSDKVTNINTIRVTMQDPVIAAVIADSILSKLQKYMVEYKTSKIKINLEKLTSQLSRVEKNYFDAEQRYADGVDQNRGLTMESAKVKLSRLENEKNIASSIYQQISLERELQQVKLDEQTPIATIIEPARVPIKHAFPSKALFMIGFGMIGAVVRLLLVFFKGGVF